MNSKIVIIVEVQEGVSLEEFKQRVLKCMQIKLAGFCKLSVSSSIGSVWSEMKDL